MVREKERARGRTTTDSPTANLLSFCMLDRISGRLPYLIVADPCVPWPLWSLMKQTAFVESRLIVQVSLHDRYR